MESCKYRKVNQQYQTKLNVGPATVQNIKDSTSHIQYMAVTDM